MLKIFFIGLLLLYYWYFYFSFSTAAPQPASGSPSAPQEYNATFVSSGKNQFQIFVNGVLSWQYTFPLFSYVTDDDRIVQRDACYDIQDGRSVPAKGQRLYDYLKDHLEFDDPMTFQENSSHTVQQGDVFYFTCENERIKSFNMCRSGEIFSRGRCQPISACTNRPDGTRLPSAVVTDYIECKNGREFLKHCKAGSFFHHDRCTPKMSVEHYCKFYEQKPFKLDEHTRIVCENGKPVYTVCKPGTQFFDKEYCEPTDCVGKPDATRLPLPQRHVDPFHFIPGYKVCQFERVDEIVECPASWNDRKSEAGDNLTFLPMVFDGQKCSIPAFGTNVFSDDPDITVPIYEFTKHVQNWERSHRYDTAAGYTWDGKSRKLKHMPLDQRIGKRFKPESACQPQEKLPIYEQPSQYYDCDQNVVVDCPNDYFFNDLKCIVKPKNAFTHKELPLFKFKPLNFDDSIVPWDYSSEPTVQCQDPESKYIDLYNICSHPDCENYAFLSMIPDLALLLPQEQKAKCKFYKKEKILRKEPVNFNYSFWDQTVLRNDATENCVPNTNISTGNFVWDKTIFKTCDKNQPFIFCPSKQERGIIHTPDGYACAPPPENVVIFDSTDWTPFAQGEVRKIIPLYWDGTPQQIRLNKNNKPVDLPQGGYVVGTDIKINLHVYRPVILQFRYRVSYPPNIAFQYDENNHVRVRSSLPGTAFLTRADKATAKKVAFPKYSVDKYVPDFSESHN